MVTVQIAGYVLGTLRKFTSLATQTKAMYVYVDSHKHGGRCFVGVKLDFGVTWV